jgi:2'-5' RNA ligase
VAVAEPALAVVGEAMAALRASVESVRWVRPEGVHVSIHFFGRLADDEVSRVLAAVGPAVTAASPFEVRLGGYGAFPQKGSPRVLWLGVGEGGAALGELARHCRQGLDAAGFEVEARAFAAHCTLGRPRPGWPRSAFRAWQRIEAPAFPPFVADRLVLFESRPGPGGSVYVERASLPFGLPPGRGPAGADETA